MGKACPGRFSFTIPRIHLSKAGVREYSNQRYDVIESNDEDADISVELLECLVPVSSNCLT